MFGVGPRHLAGDRDAGRPRDHLGDLVGSDLGPQQLRLASPRALPRGHVNLGGIGRLEPAFQFGQFAVLDLRELLVLALALQLVHLLADLQVLAVDAPEQRGKLFIGVVFKRMLQIQLVERLDDAARQALSQNRGQDQCHDQHH